MNKQKFSSETQSINSKTPDTEPDIDPEEYEKSIRQIREELLSIPLE